jgi:predicted nucleic acid-binding protein
LSTSRYVLDSFALLAFIQREPGYARVRELLREAAEGMAELHISLINLVEVRYRIIRQGHDVQGRLGAVQSLPIKRVSADAYIDAVADLKAAHPVALADCFAAALARELDCPVLTGDPEFKKLEGEVKVEWLGPNSQAPTPT